MSIKYEPSAAAISWLTLSDALKSRAFMEEALFTMFANTMKVSLEQTLNQSKFAKATAADEALKTLEGGVFQIVGGATSIGMSAYTGNQADKLLDEAKGIGTKTTEVGYVEKPLNETPSPKPPVSNTDKTEPFKEEQAVIEGKLGQSTEETNKTQTEADETQVKADKEERDKLQNQAKQLRDTGHTYANSINQAIQGLGSTAQFFAINQQGKDQAAQILAKGLNEMFNTETSQVSSAISGCDDAMKNTNSTLQTIIGVSAVRG